MTISGADYWAQVEETAGSAIETAKAHVAANAFGMNTEERAEAVEEAINDSILHETIDGHEWIIYYSYNLDILQHSANEDYMIDNLGGASEVLESSGLQGLHQALAYWALYADVQEAIQEQL